MTGQGTSTSLLSATGKAGRAEFPKSVRRQALERAGGHCEAVGKVYGLAAGTRCNAPLNRGVEFDHYPIRAADGGSNDIDNCVAVCSTCHRLKTRTFDIPQIAKGKRVRDRHIGASGHRTRSHPSFPTNRNGPLKRLMDGTVVERQPWRSNGRRR